jgi:hypothetical protein
MVELKTYKDRVRKLLELHENARNNDGTLYAIYIATYHEILVTKNKNNMRAVLLSDFKNLPPMENIRRSRQLIQNGDGEFLPTDAKVREARKIKEKNWRDSEVREAGG